MTLRFHTQTGGSTLTAQQPRTISCERRSGPPAALGGTQSLHTNGFDEALGLPTERAAKLALRTQQVLGYESGIADTVDPLAGSYFVESLTNEVDARARLRRGDRCPRRSGGRDRVALHARRDRIGGLRIRAPGRSREKVVVGVNRFEESDATKAEVFPIDEEQHEPDREGESTQDRSRR